MRIVATLIALGLIGCSANSEDTGQQSQQWFNKCHETTIFPINHDGVCANFIKFWCDDGDVDYLTVPAIAYNWIGTMCYQDQYNTYNYICMIDNNNTAVVRCNK